MSTTENYDPGGWAQYYKEKYAATLERERVLLDHISKIAGALMIGVEDGEYYIPAEPEPIICGASIVDACKAFKEFGDKMALQDGHRIAALEAQLCEAFDNVELAGAIADGYYAKCNAISNIVHGPAEKGILRDLAHLPEEVSQVLAENAELKKQVARLSAEVNQLEWHRFELDANKGNVNAAVCKLIARRAGGE